MPEDSPVDRRWAPASHPRIRIGLIVNPVAGVGGRVGLKGSDGPDTPARAIRLGARPEASRRASVALRRVVSLWSPRRDPLTFVVAPGSMGEDAALQAGLRDVASGDVGSPATGGWFDVLHDVVSAPTTAEDTRRLAAQLADSGVDLLLFAGGDGTARDVQMAVMQRVPVLGIPAGVKIQSASFGTSPAAVGRIAGSWLASARRRTVEREVLDLDEDAYRRGSIRPTLFGYLRVPRDAEVQNRKAPSPADEATGIGAIAESVIESVSRDALWILGPGTTVRGVADRLGVPKTLVGIDVVEWLGDKARLVAADANERELLGLVADRPAHIVVTPIGGQGFLFGRGNQPISPAVLRAAVATNSGGPARVRLSDALHDAITVIATPAKLAALGGRPLLVDTGDPELDGDLAGHVSVITGYQDRAVVAVAAA
jgi:predicted polyphosphate/ATP-dependent NAD kinase